MTVTSPAGECFELDQRFNRGGEAEIWALRRDPNIIAKLYHHPTLVHEAKLTAMLANPPQQAGTHPAVAWPLQLLYREQHFAGYLMPRVHESRPIFHFYNPVLRARISEKYPWRYFLHRAARNLAAAVELVHKRGYVIGDLNESNVLVNRSALVTLVDVDSFQVQSGSRNTYRSMVGKAEFTPPELQGIDFKSIDRNVAHDNFALAVLIFYLLMEGYHPFAGVHNDGISVGRVDLHGIRHGLFPYARGGAVAPPPNAPTFMWLDPTVQRLFRRAFVDGHATPALRPSATEWHETLVVAEAALVACRADAMHIYANHLGRCPHCKRTAIPEIGAEAIPELVSLHTPPNPAEGEEIPSWRQLLGVARHLGWQAVQGPALVKARRQVKYGAQESALWVGEQSTALWRGVQYQLIMLLLILRHLPKQVPLVRETLQYYGSAGQRWLLGTAIGSPIGAVAAVGGYQLVLHGATVPAIAPLVAPLLTEPTTSEQLLSPQLLWVICGLLFGATLGMVQGWALRQQLLRGHYLREWWVVVSALAGMLLGYLAYGNVTVAMILQPLWSVDHLALCGLVLLFGATLGFLQSFILRQQLQRADDSRIWTVTNAFAWLLVLESTLFGLNWQESSVALLTAAEGIPATTELAQWTGPWVGVSVGLLVASTLTGGVLLWMLRGPRRSSFWQQWAIRFIQWRFLPMRLRHGTLRWGRGLLLLALFVLLLQGLLFLGQRIYF
ncbi:MAG TPA: hypothetical protein P5121_14280 [Caldilineaceae bacterium]|nr:hypothetical protein [Caldilineaceae bacterium]